MFGMSTTLSPALSPLTASPVSSTVPTHSWPRTMPLVPAKPGGSLRTWTSVPQMLQASISTSTSFGLLTSGTGRFSKPHLPMS